MSGLLGRFLEYSVHAPDPAASVAFYEKLGFAQAPVGEARPYPYAVVSDGRVNIGLHAREIPTPTLSFVQPELVSRLGPLEEAGIEFTHCAMGSDVFNEVGFEAPEGQALLLVEARTFSPVDRPPGRTSRLGWFEEIALPARDFAAASGWWERLGFVPMGEAAEPFPHCAMTSDSLSLRIAAASALGAPALVFTDEDMAARLGALGESGFVLSRKLPAGLDAAGSGLLLAPEGTRLLLLGAA